MNEQEKNPFDPFFEEIRKIVRQEIKAANGNSVSELLTPEQLAEKLKLGVSWVYEQSRLGNIPTHRLGKYIRFDSKCFKQGCRISRMVRSIFIIRVYTHFGSRNEI